MKRLKLIKNNFYKIFFFAAMMAVGSLVNAQSWGVQTSGITDNLNDIHFVSDDMGYVVGNGGRILKTTDGGMNWDLQTTGITEDLMSVHFVNNNTGITVGAAGTIMVTVDGGDNWTTQTSGTTEDLHGVYFTSITNGFAVGANGTVLATTDAGMNWTTQTSNTTEDLNGVHFIDNMTGFAVGDGLLGGTIIATFNGGTNWTAQTTGTLNNLNGVYFIDANTGYAVGALGTILKTDNAGSNWATLVSGTISNLNAVYFTNDSFGYAVGAAGTIVRTNNSGTTWVPQTSGTTVVLNGVSIRAEMFGYAAGNTGTIIKTCPTADFTTSNDSVCVETAMLFQNHSISADSFTWVINSDTVSHSRDYTHTFLTAGTYVVTLHADNGTCSDSESQTINVQPKPNVDLGNDTVICSTCEITLDGGPGAEHTWYRNGVATGSSSRTITVDMSGVYSVDVSNSFGCMDSDTIIVQINTSVNKLNNTTALNVYPNPNNGQFNLSFEMENTEDVTVRVVSIVGKVVYTQEIKNFSGQYNQPLNLSGFAAGTYMVQVVQNSVVSTTTVVTFK